MYLSVVVVGPSLWVGCCGLVAGGWPLGVDRCGLVAMDWLLCIVQLLLWVSRCGLVAVRSRLEAAWKPTGAARSLPRTSSR